LLRGKWWRISSPTPFNTSASTFDTSTGGGAADEEEEGEAVRLSGPAYTIHALKKNKSVVVWRERQLCGM
jgi:hypothetical protein